MKKCITEIMKLLKALEYERNMLDNDCQNNSTVTYTDNENIDCGEFDLDTYLDKCEKIDCQMKRLKAIVQISNCTTKVYKDMTMQECLVYLAQLSRKKDMLARMSEINRIRRRNFNGIVEYTKACYDINKAKEYYTKIIEEINQIQMAIDLSNLTVMQEI